MLFSSSCLCLGSRLISPSRLWWPCATLLCLATPFTVDLHPDMKKICREGSLQMTKSSSDKLGHVSVRYSLCKNMPFWWNFKWHKAILKNIFGIYKFNKVQCTTKWAYHPESFSHNFGVRDNLKMKTNWLRWYSHCHLFHGQPSLHRCLGHQTSQHRSPPTADIWNTMTLKIDKPVLWEKYSSLKAKNIHTDQAALNCLKGQPFPCFTESAHLSVIAICSSMAEPVLAFQLPEMDVLLQTKQKNTNEWINLSPGK